jgi:hypothetical protein
MTVMTLINVLLTPFLESISKLMIEILQNKEVTLNSSIDASFPEHVNLKKNKTTPRKNNNKKTITCDTILSLDVCI